MSAIQKRSLCRRYTHSRINHSSLKCHKGETCRFYHPPEVTASVQEDYQRESGRCYCGAALRTIMNGRPLSAHDTEVKPFFVVCGRTYRSIRRCKKN